MATRSRIGYVLPDGKVKSIYCHWDGYPSNNGVILLKDYMDKDKVERLVGLGSISSLEKEVEPDPGAKHTFDKSQPGVTVAYHRDRGEDWKTVEPRIDDSVDAYVASDLEEWGYLFKDGNWFVIDAWHDNRKMVPLTREFIEQSE